MSKYQRHILPLILVRKIPRYTLLVWKDILSSEHSFTNFHFEFYLVVYAFTGSQLYTRQIFAILMENGTCTDGIHKVPLRY